MAAVKFPKNSICIALAFALMGACAQEIGYNASYVAQSPSPAGTALLKPNLGGAYVYGPEVKDPRPTIPAFAVGNATRDSYVFFSAQEEEVLWAQQQKFLDEIENEAASAQLSAQREAHLIAKSRRRKSPAPAPASFDWPRVVINGPSICVPSLSFANSNEWREHLICWNNGEVK